MTAEVKIGGETRALPPLTIRQLRLVLPRINAIRALGAGGADDTEAMDAVMGKTLEALACWLNPPPRGTPEEEAAHITRMAQDIEDRMLASELNAVGPALMAAAQNQGLEEAGEPQAAAAAGSEPPTSSSTPSSATSSPPAAPAEAGTP